MPLLETKGAASAQGFGLTLVGAERVFIEDVFSTFLYTGNGSTQTITNGIDLLGEGGLVWCKPRSVSGSHSLTYRPAGYSGSGSWLKTDSSDGSPGNINRSYSATGFSTSGVSVDSNNGDTFASWTLRNQPKFFTAVEYTGNGSNRTIAHNLGSVPGCIIVKRLDFTPASDWQVYHRSLANTEYLVLNSSAAVATGATRWNSTTPTSTVFSLGTDTTVNANGGTYVAYLFAHDAGGFGPSGSDNVISCGSYTGNGGASGSTGLSVTLGWEPQFLLVKSATATGGNSSWALLDSMRGWSMIGSGAALYANENRFEDNSTYGQPTATGFRVWETNVNNSGTTYIYIAIRRGPMRVPTSGTSVFAPIARTGTNAAGSITTVGFPPDLSVSADRTAVGRNPSWTDRLRGSIRTLYSSTTNAEVTSASTEDLTSFARMNGVNVGTWLRSVINAPSDIANWFFRRAPGFFDVVCYTGTGSARTVTHNLGAVPELMIVKARNASEGWAVYHLSTGNGQFLRLDLDVQAQTSSAYWNNTTPTSSVFTIGTAPQINNAGDTYVAYLFATVAGVSKVGSYTGTGSTLQINCGFTGGARFVLIKRTDSSGDWYVWDTARGIVAGNDPYLVLNSTAAEVTTTDWVDTFSSGFELSNVGGNNVNINGGTFIFLAIS